MNHKLKTQSKFAGCQSFDAFVYIKRSKRPIPSATRSKELVCGHSLAGTSGSNPAGGCLVSLNIMCCQLEVSASDGPILHPGQSYRVCVCVCVSVCWCH
jgi:hypothetical protein